MSDGQSPARGIFDESSGSLPAGDVLRTASLSKGDSPGDSRGAGGNDGANGGNGGRGGGRDEGGERPGDSIGPYKLLEVIGRGGFGVVWLAERREPMVQRVALKIIKAGMDTREVVARFEQERQALAVMDHPNVAKVFDGGATPPYMGSRPYFVMEHVPGEAITAYADRHKLSVRERLELFIPVCQAVQHAHHKGIIHRDLKPSNILVAVRDAQPTPKIIDFGIAKAISHALTEKTIFTERGQLIGTFEYMSPEQAEMGATDVDTRTDVYSLGVVLYELLAGVLPFDSKSLRRAAYDEIQRIIRDVDPPKPSTRLSTADEATAADIALHRVVTREDLTRELRKELDWIPLKALRKDRTQRYATPTDLAQDIERYLRGEPLEAGPESTGYRLRKFVRRNRVQVIAAGAVSLAVVAGLAGTLWQAREATRQRDAAVFAGKQEARQRAEAEQQRARADERANAAQKAEQAEKERADQLKKVSDFQSQMLGQIDITQAGIDLMADVGERFAAALEKAGVPEADLAKRVDALRQELVRVNATDAAAAMIDRTILKPAIKAIDEQFKGDPKTDASLRQALAILYRAIGVYDAALPLQESALAVRRRVLGEEHPDTLSSIDSMGVLLQDQGQFAEAEPYFREALEKRRRVLGEEHPDTLDSFTSMSSLLVAQGKIADAASYAHEALEKRRHVLGEEHSDTIESINNMGYVLRAQGKLAEAEPYYREALEKSRRVLGEEHRGTITSINNMGLLLQAQAKLAEAEPYLREALEKHRRVQGEEHPDTLASINNMGSILQTLGRLDEAEPYAREALEKLRRVLGEEHPKTLVSINYLGVLLQSQGKLAEAELYVREALEKRRRVLGEEHPSTLSSINSMGVLLQSQGKLSEAEPYFREALEKCRRVLGEEHPETLVSINNMGALLRDQGKLGEAEPYLREAIEMCRRLVGDEHLGTLRAIIRMGGLLGDQGRHQEAIDLLAPAESVARTAYTGANASRLAPFLTALGRARVGLGYELERFTLAESNLLEAHPIFVAAKNRGPTHKETLGCVQGLVDLYTAWHAAEPGKGYDAKAAEWKAKLDAAQPEPPKDPPAEKK